MSKSTKYIVGGGISGLIYAYYNDDYTLISPDVGGKLKNDYLSSTVLLHDTAETKRLLEDLNLTLEPKAHFMLYQYGGALHDHIPLSLKDGMVRKKLTPWDKLGELNIPQEIADSTLSTNDNYIPIFKISTNKIVSILSKNLTVIKDRVLRVTDNEIITQNDRLEYSELVSTIPAPIFWEIYGRPKQFGALPETFLLTDHPPVIQTDPYWDLIYFLDKQVPFTRVNKNAQGDYLYEFTGKVTEKDIKKFLPNATIKYLYTDPYALVTTDLNNIPPPRVRFVGRYATWNHSYKIQDTIRDALLKYDFISLWNKQKEFNTNFFNFNIKDLDLRQKQTKNFILHILDQSTSLLNETNWEMKQYLEKDVAREKILEEWVDIFKYWLGLGNVWGFTPKDFFDEFWRKSAIVDERYKAYIEKVMQKNKHDDD